MISCVFSNSDFRREFIVSGGDLSCLDRQKQRSRCRLLSLAAEARGEVKKGCALAGCLAALLNVE